METKYVTRQPSKALNPEENLGGEIERSTKLTVVIGLDGSSSDRRRRKRRDEEEQRNDGARAHNGSSSSIYRSSSSDLRSTDLRRRIVVFDNGKVTDGGKGRGDGRHDERRPRMETMVARVFSSRTETAVARVLNHIDIFFG
ncbi:hypothetical protein U1Q18_012955 [Sarracenia purpurea var. burkii]